MFLREFNVTGSCNVDEHYMVDISNKLKEIKLLVDKGRYFTINRARQYGKTTTLKYLADNLKDEYIVLRISFEGLDDSVFVNAASFNKNFISMIARILYKEHVDEHIISEWKDNEDSETIRQLGEKITIFCSTVKKPVVLIIDETDKSCNHKLFLDFLGMLRAKFMERSNTPTFYSVILAGVHDIKTIRYSGSNQNSKNNNFTDNVRKQDSPWNIAADFDIDMSFKPEEISTMLKEYEKDYNIGMDIELISNEIYKYTNGYPYLVSRICQKIDEKLDRNWKKEGVQEAVKEILVEKNTLFDDMFKNLENDKSLYDLVYNILVVGLIYEYSVDIPEIQFGVTFGILIEEGGKIVVVNEIFRIRIYNYFILKDKTRNAIPNLLSTDVVVNGNFNMELTMKKFAEHFKSIYNGTDIKFIERHCRLLFLTYLKPLINGDGFYHIESQTLDARRMDVIVDYGKTQFIIELKLWYGDNSHEKAYEQLDRYLNDKNTDTGYLLTFDFRKKKEQRCRWVNYNGKKILDVIV